jgi:hypothetical protein
MVDPPEKLSMIKALMMVFYEEERAWRVGAWKGIGR